VLTDASFMGFIPVTDVSVARAFYEGVLGLRVLDESPFAVVIDANGTSLRLTPVPELDVQPFTVAGWQVDDIHEAVRTLTDKGVGFLRYRGMDQDEFGVWTTPGGDHVAWFNDPDGNTLSLTGFAGR
jgi:catechol 2,3-dioxygenase-like lactoylglutathione lyase family enzyme